MKRNLADKYFSDYIRQRYAVNGLVECFTCGKIGEWKYMDCGHYIKRQFQGLRYNEMNCQVQCKHCNYFLQGNDVQFRSRLIDYYGLPKVLALEASKKHVTKMSQWKLDLIAETYKQKLKELA
jgi:hypothetical protein